MGMLERDQTYNDVLDRIERVEARVEDLRDVARPTEVIIYENPEWQALAGWISTGDVLRSLDGEIVLDPTIPMIQVGTGGYIQSEDFITGVSGFQINGGVAEFNDVVIRGTIYADAGEIGGWEIGTYTLMADSGAVGLNSEATGGVDWRIWAGHVTPGSAPFRVDESGNLVATNATITGTIHATLGEIGGWEIGTYTLTADSGAVGLNSEATGGTDWRIWAGHVTPGSAPFRVDEAGNLVASSATITGFIDANSGHLGSLDVDGVITVGAGAPYIQIDGGNKRIQSSSYASGISGMRIQANGDAEFNNVRVRGALTCAVFVKDLIEARAGSMVVVKSGGVLYSDMVVPASGTWTATIEDPPGGGFLFENSDICRCKTEYSAGIGDIWFVVSARADNGDGTQNYTCTYASGTRSITYPAGAPVLDYGVSGDGGLFLTADDTNGPFLDVFTHAGAPWTTLTEHLRLGNLNGLADYVSDAYGIFIGDYAGDRWMSYDPTNSLRIRGDAIIDGTIQATAFTNDIGALLFSQSDGLLLLNSNCEISPTAWVSTRRQVATISGAFHQVAGRWAESRALIIEQTTTNQVLNPSAEIAGNFSALGAATVTRSTTYALNRDYSYRLQTAANAEGISLTTVALANAIHYITFWTSGTFPASGIVTYCGTYAAPTLLKTVGNWRLYGRSVSAADANGQTSIRIVQNGAGSGDFYVDQVQTEALAYPTTYCDGSLGTGYAWASTEDGSASTRTATFVTFTATGALDLSAGSMSLWFQMPYDAGTSGLSVTSGLFRLWDTFNTESFYVSFNSTLSGISVIAYAGSAAQCNIEASLSGSVAGDWHHVVVTFDESGSGEVDVYLDGVLANTDSSYSAPSIASTTAYIGHVTARFGGAIGEFATFGRVLTAEEIAAMYALGAPLTDMGAFNKPGLYILDGQFRLASGSSGARVEIDAGGMRGYDESGTLQVGWESSGDDAGKVLAGGGNIFFDESGQTLIAPASLVRASYIQWETIAGDFRSRVGADSGGTLYIQALSALDIGLYDGASIETQLLYVSAPFITVGTDLRIDGGLAVGSPSIDPSAGAIHFVERAADPTEPSEGQAVLWLSDGTGKGDDGDVLIASRAGGVTRYATVFDHSGGSAW